MKTHILKLCLLVLLLHSCSDDDTSSDSESNSNDITISIDEYPSSGTFISAVSTNLEGDVTFNFISETAAQAIIFTQGDLAVGDWLAYDYETNPVLSAVIEATNGTETETINVTVNINNIDDIWAFLNGDSKTAYENASDGDWVLIKESEYNDLANYLTDTTRSGASNDQIFSGGSVNNSSGDRTIANNNSIFIPSSSYVFAFKYYSWVNNVVSSRVKLSLEDASGPYQYLGGILPEHHDEYNHFVLKGANDTITTDAHIGMYASGSVGVKEINNSSYKWRNGDVENLDNTASNLVYLHQGLSTTLKQWD